MTKLSTYAAEAAGRVQVLLGLATVMTPTKTRKALAERFYSVPHSQRTDSRAIAASLELALMALTAVRSGECLATIAASQSLRGLLASVALELKGLQPKT